MNGKTDEMTNGGTDGQTGTDGQRIIIIPPVNGRIKAHIWEDNIPYIKTQNSYAKESI